MLPLLPLTHTQRRVLLTLRSRGPKPLGTHGGALVLAIGAFLRSAVKTL
jgi:hypothetical protein